MINTILAGLEKSVFDRETVTFGGGEYTPDDIAEALLYIKKGVEASEDATILNNQTRKKQND